ncbi:MAG: hypothetical protein JWO53_1322 [Chlamydiia bacterium]|nr:hypothetical protein [Chlamydiia bacterium]
MDIAQKALYNSLRISWLQNQQISVEPWKVEDLRILPIEELFDRLQKKDLFIDKITFKSYADQFDGPEELTEWLISGETSSPEDYDQIYLIFFELWRRLVPEKPSISILCDEVDLQIFKYDQGDREHIEALQDALNNLHSVLEENVDRGIQSEEVFSAISEFCANDLEQFLYDYISDQIDVQNYDYANELIDEFCSFVIDKRWFDLLRARVVNISDLHQANEMIRHVFQLNQEHPSLELNLDILALLVQGGDFDLFVKVVMHTLQLLEGEDDFIELLRISSDFFRCLDQEDIQEKIDALIEARITKDVPAQISLDDEDIQVFKQFLMV